MSTPLRQIRLKNNYSLAEVAAAVGSDAGIYLVLKRAIKSRPYNWQQTFQSF